MSAFDDINKENEVTYQQITDDILKLESGISPPLSIMLIEADENINSITNTWNFNKEFALNRKLACTR